MSHLPACRADPRPVSVEGWAVTAGLAAAAMGWAGLKIRPELELACFAHGAAGLASLFTGAPVLPAANGWMLPVTGQPIVVTAACSAVEYFLIVSALVSWQLARRRNGRRIALAPFAGPVLALPLTLFVNALRVVAVTHAHRWLIPLLPESYGAFLHLLTGVAVFLPALIALNLLLEFYGNSRPVACR